MNKTEFTARLHALNADLRAAIADGAFDKVRIIDERRQELLHQIAAEDAVEGDESLLECLESFSIEVAENIKLVETQFSRFSRRASGRFKVLDGYRI
jgi:predicted HAD superfamily phosphohydrolase